MRPLKLINENELSIEIIKKLSKNNIHVVGIKGNIDLFIGCSNIYNYLYDAHLINTKLKIGDLIDMNIVPLINVYSVK